MLTESRRPDEFGRRDIDIKKMTLRIRGGKFWKSAMLPIPQACVQTLDQYFGLDRVLRLKENTRFSSRITKSDGN